MVKFIYENVLQKRLDKNSTLRYLRENLLFRDLSSRELKMVENIVNVRHYRPGESVFKQDEVGLGMYIVCSGSVNIFTEEFDIQSDTIKQNLVTKLSPGSFFGELSLVEENGRRSASAVAHDACTLIGFFKPDLLEIIQRNPIAGVKILMRLGEVLGLRLRETTSKISELKGTST